MNYVRKRKLNTFGKLIIVLFGIIILTCYFLFNKFYNNKNYDNDNVNNIDIDNKVEEKIEKNIEEEPLVEDFFEYITDSSESDPEFIKEVFAQGMNIDDLKAILRQSENYIPDDGDYVKVNYNFEKKLHYSELETMIYNFNRSDIVNTEIIGKSVDGRNIYGIEIGKGSHVLYLDANIHAAEIASTLMLIKYISEILNYYEAGNEKIISLLNDITIAIIPSINPDGYEVYNWGVDSLNNKDLWWYKNRKSIDFSNLKSNANGIDINRSFPTQNMGYVHSDKKLIKSVSYKKTTKRLIYFGGDSAGSEPETQAAMYFMLKHYKNTYIYINMHSQGRIMYAGKPNLSSEFNTLTLSFANKVAKIVNYKVRGLKYEEVGEGNDGTIGDFAAELANGFKFSTITKRLSTDKYKNNSCSLVNPYPVIVLETMIRYSTDPYYFKYEYYNHGIRKLLFSVMDYNFNN